MSTTTTPENLSIVRDAEVGLWAAIAVDDTTLGPGLGGVRLAPYPSEGAAVAEATRLAHGMTLKNATAGLPYGGAKSVIRQTGAIADRARLMRRFGSFVEGLGGTYIPGVDMGTTELDMRQMALGGATVSCARSDPSPWTAAGVFAAMWAAAAHLTGDERLAGVSVLIQGVGHVGGELARLCAEAGARVLVSDLDAGRAHEVARQCQGAIVGPDAVLSTSSDIFAPCSKAKVIDDATARRIPTQLIVGAANDTLADDAVAAILLGRGICYVPDFLANAGGVIQIHAEAEGWSERRLATAVDAIGERTSSLLARTPAGVTPLATAIADARRLIASSGVRPGAAAAV